MRWYLAPCFFLMALNNSLASLDLIDVYSLALEADTEIQMSNMMHKVAIEERSEAFSQLLPRVDISAERTETVQKREADYSRFGGDPSDISNSRFSSYGYAITLKQTILDSGKIILYEKTRDQIKQANTERMAAEQLLMLRVVRRYFAVLMAKNNLRLVEVEKLAVKKQLAQAQSRFEAGLMAITDVYEARAQLDISYAAEIKARNKLFVSLEALRELTNQQHEHLRALASQFEIKLPDLSDVSEWELLAMENNPTLIAMQYANNLLRKEIQFHRTSRYPELNLIGTYSKNQSGGGDFGKAQTDSHSLMLQLNVPLFEGGYTNSKVKQAIYHYERNLEAIKSKIRSIRQEVHQAYLGVESSFSLIGSLKQSVLSSTRALQSIEEGIQAGVRSIADVFNANKNLFRAERDFQEAKINYIVNYLKLKYLAGKLTVKDLRQVNAWLE